MWGLEHFGEVLGTLRRHILRTSLTAVGVFWGVFLLVLMVGFGNGLETGMRKGMSGWATNSMFVWGERTSTAHKGMGPGRYVRLTLDDAAALRRVPGVSLVAPRVQLGGHRGNGSVTRGEKSGEFTVMGDEPDIRLVQPMDIQGRFLNHLDVERRRKVVVIGPLVQQALFADHEEPIGESITIGSIDFMVVGTFKSRQTGDSRERHEVTVYMPLSTFQKVVQVSPYIHYMAVLTDPGVRVRNLEDTVKRVLKKRHDVAPDDPAALGSFDLDKMFQQMEGLFSGISFLVWFVAVATLLAGLVGVSNIMMVSVRERTREIGIRKAIGATPSRVMAQIVSEAVVLASIAGFLGMVSAVGLLELIGFAMQSDDGSSVDMFAAPQVTLSTALFAAVAVAIGGGFAGLFPALNAARIRTVLALRD